MVSRKHAPRSKSESSLQQPGKSPPPSPRSFPTADGDNAQSGNGKKLTKPPEGGALLPFTGLRVTAPPLLALSTQGLLGRRWHHGGGKGGWGHPSGLPKTRVPCLACCQWTTSGSVPKSSVSEDPSTCPTALLRIEATSCEVRSVRPGPYRSRHRNCSRSSGFRSELLQPPLPSPPPAPCNGEGFTVRGASHPGGGQSSTLGPGRLPVLVELLVQGCGIGKPRFRSQRAHRRPCGSRAPALPLKTRGPRLMEQGKAGSQRHF